MLLLSELDAALHVVSAAALGLRLRTVNLNNCTTKKRHDSSDDEVLF
jgi:hypothetical protein